MIDSIVEYVIGLPLFWNVLLSSLAFITPFALVLFSMYYCILKLTEEEKLEKNEIIDPKIENLKNGIDEIDECIFQSIKTQDRILNKHNSFLRDLKDLNAEYFEVNTNSLS